MDGRSILWILTFGVVLILAPRSNANSFRRSTNSNINMNSNMAEPRIYRTTRRPRLHDQDIVDYISPHNMYPRGFPAGSDPADVAAVARAAADATLSVTKNLAEDISETAAVAVAEAVSRILGKARRRPGVGRRSSNINTNYNYNLRGQPSILTDSEDHETIPKSDILFQPEDSSASLQDHPDNMDKRYFVVPGRDSDRLEWDESRYSEHGRELSRVDLVKGLRCRYQPAVCGKRRTGPVSKMELMDDHASDPTEETRDLLGEADEHDVEKEVSDDDKDDILLPDDSLNTPSNVTTSVEPKLARRAKNRNHNRNLKVDDSRPFFVRAPSRKRARTRLPRDIRTRNYS